MLTETGCQNRVGTKAAHSGIFPTFSRKDDANGWEVGGGAVDSRHWNDVVGPETGLVSCSGVTLTPSCPGGGIPAI